jgi:hypothetical protein
MSQALLLLLSGSAAWLVTRGTPGAAALGCALGLLGQPLWLWSSWRARQWGIFALSVWYFWSWGTGLALALAALRGAHP